jgi:DNA-binding response OmpR family regulator
MMSMQTKKILLADDDAGVREMVGRVLESEHYEVMPARTGREAARKFIMERPDLVLLDLNMPDRDGWEAFDLMNSTRHLVPVIIITARPQQYDHAADLGVDALMEKPLDLQLLLRTIAGFLAESDSERVNRLTSRDFKTVWLGPGRKEAMNESES